MSDQTAAYARTSKKREPVSDKMLSLLLAVAIAAVLILLAIPTPHFGHHENAGQTEQTAAVSDTAAETSAERAFFAATLRADAPHR